MKTHTCLSQCCSMIHDIYDTYIKIYMLRTSWLTVALALMVGLATCGRVLVVLDNRNLETTHSQFIESLKLGGANEVKIAYSFGSEAIKLKHYDQHKYEHIVVMSTSDKGTQGLTQTLKASSRPGKSSLTSMKEAT